MDVLSISIVCVAKNVHAFSKVRMGQKGMISMWEDLCCQSKMTARERPKIRDLATSSVNPG